MPESTTKVFDELRAKIGAAASWYVKVGVLASQGGDNLVPGTDITLTDLMAIHEFGSEAAGIKERSSIRSTFQRNEVRDGLEKLLARSAREIIADKSTPEKALGVIGSWGAAQIKNTIKHQQTTGPEDQANAPSTIARKGSSTPLVDTGQLINAVSWEVIK